MKMRTTVLTVLFLTGCVGQLSSDGPVLQLEDDPLESDGFSELDELEGDPIEGEELVTATFGITNTIDGFANPSGNSWKEHFIDLQKGDVVNLSLNWNTDTDFNLFIYDTNNELAAFSNGSAKPETITYEAVASGSHRIGIKAKSGQSGAYSISIDVEPSGHTLENNAAGGVWITHPIVVPAGVTAIDAELSWAQQSENLNLFLIRPDGSNAASANKFNFPETLSYDDLFPGTWTLAIKHKTSRATNYTIHYRFTGSGSEPTPPQPPSVVSGPLVPEYGVLFGSNGDFQEPGGRFVAYRTRESQINRQYDIFHDYSRFGDQLPKSQQVELANEGRVLLLNWKPQNHQSWRGIANGNFDSIIRTTARGIRNFGQPMFLAFHHEMDTGHNTSTFGSSADYIAAYRHIYDVFRAENVQNVVWVWNPTGWNTSRLAGFYPGDAYVDWIGFDIYNWSYCRGEHDAWRSFEEMIRPAYDWAQATHADKPIMLPEWGAQENSRQGQTRAQWFDEVIPTIKAHYPALKALIYFDTNVGFQEAMCQWQVDNSNSSLAAYGRLVRDEFTNVMDTVNFSF